MNRKKQKMQGNLDFRMMVLEFKLRDWLRPPVKVLKEAGLGPGMTVLDFGCGTGGFSIAASRLVGPQGLVYAVDIHPLALQTVRRAAEKKGLENLRVIESSGLASIPDESVDGVLLYDVLHDLPDPRPVLVELHRILRPAGFLSISDHHLSNKLISQIETAEDRFQFTGWKRWSLRYEKDRNGPVRKTN